MSWRVIWIPELLGAVLGGIFVFRLGMGTMPKTVLHACEEFTGMLRESRRYENWVTGTEKKLRKNGAKFHYGKKITPVKYLLMRLFLFLGAVLAHWELSAGDMHCLRQWDCIMCRNCYCCT